MAASPVVTITSDDANTTNFPMKSYGFGVEALDAFNTTNSASAGSDDQWQSFTVSNTGRLTKVAWEIANPVTNGAPQPVNLKVYRGEGTNGTLLASSENLFTPAYSNDQGNYIQGQLIYYDLSAENINVSAGETLTIRLSLPDGNVNVGFLNLSNSNPYTGGRGSNSSSWDYVFETHVRPISEGTESWQYSYNVPDTIQSSFTATVSGTDTYGNAYSRQR